MSARPIKIKSPTERKRMRLALTEEDFACIDFLVGKFGYSARVDAVRYAVSSAATTAPAGTVKYTTLISRTKDAVSGMHKKSHEFGKEEIGCQYWACWLTGQDKSYILSLQKRWGLERMAEAIRMAVRVQSRLVGYDG